MAGFSDSLWIEVVPYEASVTVIHPGFMDSEDRGRAFSLDGKPLVQSPVREARSDGDGDMRFANPFARKFDAEARP